MTKLKSAMHDNIVAWVVVVIFVVLTISSTITMRRSFDNARRSDTKALISYVRCLLVIPRDIPDRISALDACATAAIAKGNN